MSQATLIQTARIAVREAGYAAQKVEAMGERGELYSAILHAYDMICSHLMLLDPPGAADFISRTYGPAFRQVAA